MCDEDVQLKSMLHSAQMTVYPRPAHLAEVRETTLSLLSRRPARSRVRRLAVAAAVSFVALSGIGLATTEAGRAWLRAWFIPVGESHTTQWVAPDGGLWTQMREGEAYTAEEAQEVADTYDEIYQIKEAGGGRLVGLMENPGLFGGGMTIYRIEYTLSTGQTVRVGSGKPDGLQAENMRIAEILRLRDAGEGEVLEESPSEIGLGRYLIRFALSDDQDVDLQTFYPPGTLDERARIFTEMWQLKTQRRFDVLRPWRVPEAPEQGVWGLLRYTLSDGRVVGTVEQVPPDLISEDGAYVILPFSDETVEIRSGQTGGSEP